MGEEERGGREAHQREVGGAGTEGGGEEKTPEILKSR